MKLRLHIVLFAALALSAFALPSHAQIFGGNAQITRQYQYRPWQARWHHAPKRAPSYPEYYHYMNSQFPKYYGGFHASYFQDMGMSPGDTGLRGNGIFPTPW